MNNKVLERLFQAAAGLLACLAIYFLWQGNFDRVFVSAVLGSLSFFIAIRFQVKERLEKREEERMEEYRESAAAIPPVMPADEFKDPVKSKIRDLDN